MNVSRSEFRDKTGGILIGTALGDSLGFIAERLRPQEIQNRFGKITRFHVLGNHGFVTDDTEQTALVAFSLARNHDNVEGCVRDFRRSLLLWYLCFPFGIGRATIRACTRIAIGARDSGVNSAGNGAAMRAAIIGGYFHDQYEHRMLIGTALARVTHCDARAVEGSLFVGELACLLCSNSNEPLDSLFWRALECVKEPGLRRALEKSAELAAAKTDTIPAAEILNGAPCAFIVNSLPFSTFAFLRWGNEDVLTCLSETISGGGDADTNAAIVGAWLGAMRGEAGLPAELVARIDDGPFGPRHLRQLADALVDAKYTAAGKPPTYSLLHSALRNVLLVPVILFHATMRLLPAGRR